MKNSSYQPIQYRSIYTYGNLSPAQINSGALFDRRSEQTVGANSTKSDLLLGSLRAVVIGLGYIFIVITFPFSLLCAMKFVQDSERLIIFRLGRLRPNSKGPGPVILLPLIDSYVRIDVRTRAFSIPPTSVITSDEAELTLGGEFFYQIVDPVKAVLRLQSLEHLLRSTCKAEFTRHLSTLKLEEICGLQQSNQISMDLCMRINVRLQGTGVRIQKLVLSPVTVAKGPGNALDGLVDQASLFGSPQAHAQLLKDLFCHFSTIVKAQSDDSAPSESQPEDGSGEGTERNGQVAAVDTADSSAAIEGLVEVVKSRINAEMVRKINGSFLFKLLSPKPPTRVQRVFLLNLRNIYSRDSNGLKELRDEEEWASADVDATISITKADLMGLLSNKLAVSWLYLTGRLQVDGDIDRVKSLQGLFQSDD